MLLNTVTQPIKAVWYKSWTKLLGKAQLASGAVLTATSTLNTYVSDPTFKSYLDVVQAPKYIIIGIATLGLITWLAHGREND